jgi:hypothetical protein
LRLSAEEKSTAEEKAITKDRIHDLVREHKEGFGSRYKVTAGRTKDSAGTLITQAMVGQHIGARSGYRQCLVKDLTTTKGN